MTFINFLNCRNATFFDSLHHIVVYCENIFKYHDLIFYATGPSLLSTLIKSWKEDEE